MGQNPISWSDIDAYNRARAFGVLGAWEIDLICRLDDAVLTVWAKQRPKAGEEASEAAPVTPATFRAIAAQKRAERGG